MRTGRYVCLIVFALILAGLQFGCDRRNSAVVERKEEKPVAFAVVNGEPLTEDLIRDTVRISARIRELATGQKKATQYGAWSNRYAMKIIPMMIQALLFDQDLKSHSVQPTVESDGEVLDKYNRLIKRNVKSKQELAALFGDLRDAFLVQFERESRFAEIYRREKLAVKESDISQFYNTLSNRIQRCAAINKSAHMKAQKAWDELQRGISWETVATNCTEDAILEPSYADNWKDWVQLSLGQIEPPELSQSVSKLKQGEYTHPISTDEGLVIVRLVDKEGEFCSLARILFRTAIDIEIPTRDEVVQNVLKEKRHSFQGRYLTDVRKKARIEYPMGTNFYYRIWAEEPSKVNFANGK